MRVGAVMATGTLGVLLAARDQFTAEVALTMAFTTFVLFQVINVLNARVETHTVFTKHLFTNRWLWASIGSVLALQVAAVHSPWLQPIFDTVALTAGQWAICAAVALSVLIVEEALKLGPTAYGWVTGWLSSPRARRAERERHTHETE
jgi:Ca2+-transporting ATPase